MKLTHNEHKVLMMLMENGRLKDSVMGRELGISTPAARKIRKGLEEKGVISGYSAMSRYHNVGVTLLAVLFLKPARKRFTSLEEREEIERALMKVPCIISAARLPHGNPSHMLFMGFKDFDDMNSVLQEMKVTDHVSAMEIKHIHIFSHKDVLKSKEQPFRMFLKRLAEKERPRVLEGIE